MGARERFTFELTPKATEELANRTHRLDVRARNILFLIQRGYPTLDGILENSIFPRDEVLERLRELLRADFVTLQSSDPTLAVPTTISPQQGPTTIGPVTETTSDLPAEAPVGAKEGPATTALETEPEPPPPP